MQRFALTFCLLLLPPAIVPAQETRSPSRWEPQIKRFEEQDQQHPPTKNGNLFVGSSSIRLWDLQKSFPGYAVLNRGFGGSEVSDSLYFANRIILLHQPRVVVLYAGDNDVAHGKTAEVVSQDVKRLVSLIHSQLPKTRFVFISIKPSIKRWELVADMRKSNMLVKEMFEQDERLVYVDIDSPMIGKDGRPRPELFAKDGLHLSPAGYAVWNARVTPYLAE